MTSGCAAEHDAIATDDAQELFAIFDAEHRGSIGMVELAEGFRALGQAPSHDELQRIFVEADEDANVRGSPNFHPADIQPTSSHPTAPEHC